MKLIFNGDDFGITEAVNHAIVDCFKAGLMKSTSLMTNMPAARSAAEKMKKLPGLSVGLHLNLTTGYPLNEGLKTIITPEGTLDKHILSDARHVDLAEIELEINAQFERFVALTDQLPDHINSHHGIEQIPGAQELQLQLAKQYQLPIRRFFTLPTGNHPDCSFVLPTLCTIQKKDWSVPIYPNDIIDFFSPEMINSDEIYEICGHPEYVDYELLQLSSLTTARCYDAHNFMCDEIKNWVAENRIELISFADLPFVTL